ncbi:carbonic anhydrase [Aquimarina mytili]|uniref:Carbonic anhydrase n=1 Tax=Aquimarina mytili TaxID=874423 RepID=A0A937D6U5_9FLAO|nr:carbonic anhydrase family protein [Aquimarina mytili]MBL0682450.1 carbonic anhydrase family protein [Aquimarina mytili]
MKTNILKYALVFGLLSIFTSCENQQIDTQDQNQEVLKYDETSLSDAYFGRKSSSGCHFEYEGSSGPEFWADLCGDDWKDCGGNSQSPINIITDAVLEDESINNINTNYTISSTNIFNNGHTIQFNYDAGSSASLNNIDYNLLQFHFHTGSEHTVDGVRYPMEMHLVHQDPITKLLAVVGVFFKEGNRNLLLNQFMNNLPEYEDDHYTSSQKYHIKDILPGDMDFYTYSGSLTTPACSEIVTWYIIKETIEASHEQLERFEHIMHKNFRPIQTLSGRIVSTND